MPSHRVQYNWLKWNCNNRINNAYECKLYSSSTCTNVNGRYWNTYKLFLLQPAVLVLVSMWLQPTSELRTFLALLQNLIRFFQRHAVRGHNQFFQFGHHLIINKSPIYHQSVQSTAQLPVLRRVCPNMSPPHPLRLFSEVASRLSSSGIPSHEFYHNFCLVPVQCHFRTLKAFFVLTKLLTKWHPANYQAILCSTLIDNVFTQLVHSFSFSTLPVGNGIHTSTHTQSHTSFQPTASNHCRLLLPAPSITRCFRNQNLATVWLSGSIVGSINEVTLHWAGLVLRWVTSLRYISQLKTLQK